MSQFQELRVSCIALSFLTTEEYSSIHSEFKTIEIECISTWSSNIPPFSNRIEFLLCIFLQIYDWN